MAAVPVWSDLVPWSVPAGGQRPGRRDASATFVLRDPGRHALSRGLGRMLAAMKRRSPVL